MNKKKGFTLSETLITLGIIGVVAALTLPALIADYNINIVTTRLKRQYSLYLQAKMAITPQINKNFSGGNADESVEFYKEFYAPYIKSISIKPENKGVLVKLNDGSGMLFWSRETCNNCTDFEYVEICPKYKDCVGLPCKTYNPEGSVDGIKSFMLYAGTTGALPSYHWQVEGNGTRAELVHLCDTIPAYCYTLIAYDGWEIKKDYPHIKKF